MVRFFFEAGQFVWVSGLACTSQAGLPRGPQNLSSFGSFLYTVAVCRGPFPGRLSRPRRSFGFVTVYSHPPFSLCQVAGGPCLPHPWPGWHSGLRSGCRVWTLRGRLEGAEDLSGCPPGLNRPGGGVGVGGFCLRLALHFASRGCLEAPWICSSFPGAGQGERGHPQPLLGRIL